MPNIFKDGGGAGIGSFVVVFKDGQLAENTDLAKLRGAYESGDSIFISIIDEGTEDALVPASGWIDEEAKLHLVARDFDDNKTYSLELGSDPTEPIEAQVEDGIEAGGEPLGGASLDGTSIVVGPMEEPTPVIEIDGVKYFHEARFDIGAISAEMIEAGINDKRQFRISDFLEIEIASDLDNTINVCIEFNQSGGEWHISKNIYAGGNFNLLPAPSDYANMLTFAKLIDGYAFPATMYQVGPNWPVNIVDATTPNCSALYLKYDEATNILTCYYNLKQEGPSKVNSVKSGETVLPIVDERLPEAAVADEGKVVKVGATGAYELGEAGGSGEKTYDGSSVSTVADLLALVGIDMTPEQVIDGGFYKITGLYNTGVLPIFAEKLLIIVAKQPGQQLDVELMYYGLQPAGFILYIYDDLNATLSSVQPLVGQFMPQIPSNTNKEYFLKCVGGAPTWVEDPGSAEIG